MSASAIYTSTKPQAGISGSLVAIFVFSLAGLIITAALSWGMPLDVVASSAAFGG